MIIKILAKYLREIENKLAVFTVFLLALFPVMEVVARKVFHTGVPNSTDYVHHLVLVLTFLAGMITTREKEHLSLALNFGFSEKIKSQLYVLIGFFASFYTAAFAWASLSFCINGFSENQKVGLISVKYVVMVVAVGYAVMAVRFVLLVEKGKYNRPIASLGLVFGTLLALKPVINVIATLTEKYPEIFDSLIAGYESVIGLLAIPLIIVLILCAFFGMPIFIILGGIAFLLFANTGQSLEVVPNEAYTMLISHSIPAIPLFTIAGFLLSESKAGERLVNLFKFL